MDMNPSALDILSLVAIACMTTFLVFSVLQ